ncbi:MAG: transposase, partial [Chloroflexi bacterium]|nr:transposase [Chloroflexota bacterium]
MGVRRERKRLRLPAYDYTTGAYFITTVTRDRAMLFGRVVNGVIRLNEAGRVVADTWQWLAAQYPYVTVDAWVVMPNHTHAIIVIRPDHGGVGAGRDDDVGAGRDRPLR